MLCYLLFYTMKKLNVEKKGSLVVVKNFSVSHLLKPSISPSLLVIRGFGDTPHATCPGPLWTARDGWEAQRNHSLSTGPSIHVSLLLSVCLTARESIRLNVALPFLAVHLHPCLAACQPDQPACPSLHLMAGLSGSSLPPCLSVSVPPCLSVPLRVWWSSFMPPIGRAFIHHGQAKFDSIIKRLQEENSLKLMGNCSYRMIKNTFCEWRYLSLLDREWPVL